MEQLTIYSSTNTKLKSIAWGMVFIAMGLVFGVMAIRLCFTQGFSAIYYVFAILIYSVFIFAGVVSINWRKYPLVLSANGEGIHYFVFVSRIGYSKKEVIVPWEAVTNIKQYQDERFDEDEYDDAIVIDVSDEFDAPPIIWLVDTDVDSDDISDIVSKLNDMREFYSRS